MKLSIWRQKYPICKVFFPISILDTWKDAGLAVVHRCDGVDLTGFPIAGYKFYKGLCETDPVEIAQVVRRYAMVLPTMGVGWR